MADAYGENVIQPLSGVDRPISPYSVRLAFASCLPAANLSHTSTSEEQTLNIVLCTLNAFYKVSSTMTNHSQIALLEWYAYPEILMICAHEHFG